MTALFITATGTDCGKTHVSSALLRELTRTGRTAIPIKPMMSGYGPHDLASSDAGRLLASMGHPVTADAVADVCWRSFTPWLAPNVAARQAGVALPYADMLAFVHERLGRPANAHLVEGAGGVMSPLTDQQTNIDLMADLGLPVLLLTSSYLGAVSHTLTALEAIDRRGLSLRAIVVTQPSADAGDPQDFTDELQRWTLTKIAVAPYAPTLEADRRYASSLTGSLFS